MPCAGCPHHPARRGAPWAVERGEGLGEHGEAVVLGAGLGLGPGPRGGRCRVADGGQDVAGVVQLGPRRRRRLRAPDAGPAPLDAQRLGRSRRQLAYTARQFGTAPVPGGAVHVVAGQAQFGVRGQEVEVVREGIQALAVGRLRPVVVIVLVLGGVGPADHEEQPGVGPLLGQRATRDAPRLGEASRPKVPLRLPVRGHDLFVLGLHGFPTPDESADRSIRFGAQLSPGEEARSRAFGRRWDAEGAGDRGRVDAGDAAAAEQRRGDGEMRI